jgi:hypothetical protein
VFGTKSFTYHLNFPDTWDWVLEWRDCLLQATRQLGITVPTASWRPCPLIVWPPTLLSSAQLWEGGCRTIRGATDHCLEFCLSKDLQVKEWKTGVLKHQASWPYRNLQREPFIATQVLLPWDFCPAHLHREAKQPLLLGDPSSHSSGPYNVATARILIQEGGPWLGPLQITPLVDHKNRKLRVTLVNEMEWKT